MAEVKNSFLKSKMNQDLDDRLLPNGEYRSASNISVGKSENDDIGTLQNILGNERLPLTTNTPLIPGTEIVNPNYIPGLECIGMFMDNQNNRIFQFLTNYGDPNPNQITFPQDVDFSPEPNGWVMKITMYDFGDPVQNVTLVEGLFLNFAKNKEFKITGVNLVEGLLFWTDNRNQPRKINIQNALTNPNYYTTEEQISVAKYAPVDPISLYRKVVATVSTVTSSTVFNVPIGTAVVKGMTVISDDIQGSEYITVSDYNTATGAVTLYKPPTTTIAINNELTFLISTMSDKSSVPSWPGDPAFLEDKYVRFSYRFKFDDNEYSLMAPFTQIAYIPKQKGFFIDGNETDAYRSTVINWFENNINNIDLIVPFPDKVGNLTNSYKIQEIDILYKESDASAIKVFETIPISSINTLENTNNNFYIQPYQSQKPYKTLPEDQTTRVYDKVPVRAVSQESAGNRIIYGNYYDKYTSLSSINYNISVQPKSSTGTNFIEYPNHTLKKNRNYQVGFVIADKFGRQSPVILSSVDLSGTSLGGDNYTKGSTVYSSYENTTLFEDVRSWFGDALILYLNSTIDQIKDIPSGKPGLYAIPTSNSGFAITDSTITDTSYIYILDTTAASNTTPAVGNILRGHYTDYVRVTSNPIPTGIANQYIIDTSGRVNDVYLYEPQIGGIKDIKFSYKLNPIGWYSYKIVVKQQEQDYYNVYLPGMLNGYPKNQTSGSQIMYSSLGVPTTQTGINVTQFPVSETGNTSHIVLINDNINKVPRDLNEIGPDQKQYRSSVQLYGRVQNTRETLEIIGESPDYSSKTITLTYSTTTVGQGDWTLIKPGDGIQCEEANTPVPDTTPPATAGATKPNLYRWLGNTVVVSNEVSGTIGTIVISSPNWVLNTAQNPIVSGPGSGDYKTFIITRAENEQYFPTRKADTVISIAYADEFNFIDNSENNLSGTAGLNFYQLQNKPLIGRVSTVNEIGVTASDMIPFLSVYETRPEQSLLEIFWETATTGLISDLNTDVSTGFKGPVGFGEVNYTHREYQDPSGTGATGAADSKYITDPFYVLGQEGFPFPNTEVTLISVIDGNGITRTSDFGIQYIGGGINDLHRLYIVNPFTFNNDAEDRESYVFSFFVKNLDEPETATTLTIEGRLGNNNPIILTSELNYNITQATTNFVTLEAVNGSFYSSPTPPAYAKTGLKWNIVSGDAGSYFQLNEYTGVLSLIDNEIPLGVYELEIKVRDAVNTSSGAILPPENTTFGTQSDTITLIINVGDEPVPYTLRPLYTGCYLSPGSSSFPYPFPVSPPAPSTQARYGIVYLGPKEITYNTSGGGVNSYLPTIPGSGGYYGATENPEQINFPSVLPQGLTEGEYRISVDLIVPVPAEEEGAPMPAQSNSAVDIYLYRRVYNSITPGVWELVKTTNNVDTPYFVMNGSNSSIGGVQKLKRTSLKIKSDSTIFYEWAIGIKMTNFVRFSVGEGPSVVVHGEDANYTYDQITPNYNMPITTAYEYNTGVDYLGQPQGVPWETLDSTRGITYSSTGNTVSSGTADNGQITIEIQLTTVNNQLSPGLRGIISGTYASSFTIAAINVDGNPNKIAIELFAGFAGPNGSSLNGYSISFTTIGSNSTLGKIYSSTKEGTEIKRLYKDAGLTQKWIPPVPDRYYVFRTNTDYDPGDAGDYTKYPFFSAKINADGEVIPQPGSVPNIQTAWDGPTTTSLTNYSWNIYYEEGITPEP